MATIHPSRMAFVPHEPASSSSHPRDRHRGRSPSPRRRSPSPSRGKGTLERRARDGDVEDRRRSRNRGRSSDKRGRSRSTGRSGDDGREDGRARRASPVYGEYRRPSPPRRDAAPSDGAQAPWRQEENMYPKRSQGGGGYGGGGGGYGGGGGSEFMDSRREQRDKSSFIIWPSSPKAPTRSSTSPDPKRHKKSRKHRRSPSSSDSDDSEEERRRRDRKERKKARKDEKKKSRGKDKDRERRRSRSVEADSEDERDRREKGKSTRGRRSRSRDRNSRSASNHVREHRTKSPEARPPSSEVDMEDDWVEAPAASTLVAAAPSNPMPPPPVPASASGAPAEDEDSDDEVGPKPLVNVSSSKKIDERQYGGALLRGEGSAMAAFLQDGTDSRIPRRGEIGLSSDEIASYESVGYVMSGSRHRRMNAVRMRKENQVISAEEKRGILKLQQEERERREAILREEFEALVDDKLKAQGKP